MLKVAIGQMSLFMRILKHDRFGIKKVIFDSVDPVLKGTSSFSYHREIAEVSQYLNREHDLWLHPMDDSIQSNKSFLELYNEALEDGAHMVDAIEKICKSGNIHKDDVYSIIPDIASTYGLECGRKFQIRNKKVYKNE